MFDVVLLYAPPWAGPTRFSKHHLASYFARRGARVLYVEAPLTSFGMKRGRRFVAELRHALRPPRLVADRLWVRRHFSPVPYHAATRLTSRRVRSRCITHQIAGVSKGVLQRRTFALFDGARIEINGTTGQVTILDEGADPETAGAESPEVAIPA